MGKPRECSQQQIMGHVSAFKYMTALGARSKTKQGGRFYHWAHRRAHCLGGKQARNNLDAMTAAANYFTLFLLEMPLKKLLLDDKVPEVFIEGEVHFNPKTGLPFEIKYHLSWGLLDFLNITIDPMSHSRPSWDDCLMAQKLLTWEAEPASLSM